MNKIIQIVFALFLLGLVVYPANAAFTSLYIFGDGTSTTTNNTSGYSNYYYGGRFSNGRVWVEVLAQRLGMGANSISNVNWFDANNDWSYFGQYSPNLIANLKNFAPPPDVKTALFVVWVNDADFVNDMATVYPSTDPKQWSLAIGQSITNHLIAINNLYAKGVRTLIMPNAVDITEIPQYSGIPQANKTFVRQQVINFNLQFAALLQQEQISLPGLTIYQPNFFGLLDNVITNASAYGLTNYQYNGINSYAVSQSGATMNGQGSNYIFWDPTDPTAKFHEIMADTVQQMVAPVSVGQVAVLSPITSPVYTNRLQLLNVPVGLNGFVEGTTNLGQPNYAWTTVTNITATSVTQSIYLNAQPLPAIVAAGGSGSIYPGGGSSSSGSSGNSSGTSTTAPSPGNIQAYRLKFPFAWSWP